MFKNLPSMRRREKASLELGGGEVDAFLQRRVEVAGEVIRITLFLASSRLRQPAI